MSLLFLGKTAADNIQVSTFAAKPQTGKTSIGTRKSPRTAKKKVAKSSSLAEDEEEAAAFAAAFSAHSDDDDYAMPVDDDIMTDDDEDISGHADVTSNKTGENKKAKTTTKKSKIATYTLGDDSEPIVSTSITNAENDSKFCCLCFIAQI